MSYETTPGRKTHVRINPPDTVLLEPIVAHERTAFDMLRGAASSESNAWLMPETGWRLEPYQRRASSLSELAALSPAVLGAADLTVATGFLTAPAFRQETDLAGMTYGSGVSTSGDLFYQKQVGAGQSWGDPAFVLSADQASFPSATAGSENAPMDRVAVGTSVAAADGEWFLRFTAPGGRMQAPDHVLTFYFTGPAYQGLGQWAIAFGGDGYADIFERSTAAVWQEVDRVVWCPAHQVGRVPHLVHIAPQPLVNNPKLSGIILFEFTLAREPARSASAPGRFVPQAAESKQAVISIPLTALQPQPAPLRLDIRRDIRIQFQVSKASLPTSGVLTDDAFSVSFYPTAAQPYILSWSAATPNGCAVAGHLIDAVSGLELTRTGTVGGFPVYAPAYPARTYFVRFDLTGSGWASPTLVSYRLQRDAVLAASRAVEVDVESGTTSVSIVGADDDPSHESATVHVEDLIGGFAALAATGELALQVETEYDPTDASKRAVLHRGAVVRPEAGYRPAGRVSYRLTSVGMWQRLAEALSPIRFNFGLDYSATGPNGLPLPFKVTDALRTLFGLAGYGSASLDIPDLPIRLFASGDSDGLLIEPQASLADLIVRYARDYLGYLVLADANVGAGGVWRVRPLGTSANILATFQSGGPGAGKLVHALPSYPANTAFMRRRSHRSWVKPPDGNVVIAFGAANAAAGGGVPLLFKQVVVNPLSFDFGGAATADPTAIDYLGRARLLYQYLPAQAGPDAVSWVARRVYDVSCHGKRLHAFQAPLLLVQDGADTLLTHLRPLRVNDCVNVDSTACRLRSVSPAFAKDAHQFAFYEAEEL
ncbi:MAG: hypothetical protein ACYC96_15260 [Fimbriimonadaceae bacterium]